MLAIAPDAARAQAIFLPSGDDSYLRTHTGVDVQFSGQPDCSVQACDVFDRSSTEADLFTLVSAAPVSLGGSVENVGFPGLAIGSASSSGTLEIMFDGNHMSEGTIDLSTSMSGLVSQPHQPDEALFLLVVANAPIALAFETTAPASIHFFGWISKTNTNPDLFDDDTSVEFRRTAGNVHATFAEAGAFDLGWVPLVVGERSLILADVDIQLYVDREDCECVGSQLTAASSVHIEFEIVPVPEPDGVVGTAAALATLGILVLRRPRAWARS